MRTFTVKGADGEDISHNVFEMVGFPPLIDYQMAYPVILERSCYRTIFNGLMEKTKEYLGTVDVNLVVDGNPGIGKSRFYLYCIFRLVHGLLDEDKTFGEYILVLNCGEKYHKYSWKEKVFTTVNKEEVARLQRVKNVVRLIEATSSELLSWMGVSILFSSPELQKVSKFKRITSWSFISPVWSLDELQVCNMFLDSRLKLTDDDLVSRYSEYGGIPRSVFSLNQQEKRDNVAAAIDSFDPDILSFSKPVHAIHFNVVAMVPTTPETFETLYEFMFLSKVIADKIVMQEREDIVAQLAQALVPNVRYDFDETFRGQLYELFVHRWFAQSTKVKAKTISLRTLGKTERVTYYRSTSREFAVDALILEPTTKAETFAGVCYGLLMTINAKQPIDAKGVDKLVKWSTARNYSFVYVFVVPSALEANYMWQQIDSLSGEEHNRTRYLNDMVQLVAAVDPYIDIKPNRRKV
ncbi:Crinkler (CRN) [Phytophthora megakarya]|uniref:Crinkler (CRN) n=1 Tax=Phytophthora megakarya TaxID=4795 RepID=A0A225UQQ0_9STRA|nr:Crinkler (CRN) [Phytophthora megakarya]